MKCWRCKEEMTHFSCKEDDIGSGFLCVKCGAKTVTQASVNGGWLFVDGKGLVSTISDYDRWHPQSSLGYRNKRYGEEDVRFSCVFLLEDGGCDLGQKDGCMHTTPNQKCGLHFQSSKESANE